MQSARTNNQGGHGAWGMRPISPWLALAAVLVSLTGCVTTSPREQEAAASRVGSLVDSAPSGAAVLLVYGEAQGGWEGGEASKVLNSFGPLSFHDRFDRIVAARGDRKIHVYYLYPGDYRLNGIAPGAETDVARVITLGADENRFLKFAAGKALDFREVDLATALADARTGGYQSGRVVRHDFHTGYTGYLRDRLLGARSVRLSADEGCLIGESTAEWANATMTLYPADCEFARATLRYDDGTRVRLVLNRGTWQAGSGSSRRLVLEDGLSRNIGHFDDGFWEPAPWEDRLYLNPGPYATIEHPDGRRYDGHVQLDDAGPGEVLPAPTPGTLGAQGQLRRSDGSGYLGRVDEDGPAGGGYCFDASGGEVCWLIGNTRHDVISAVPIRTRAEILQDVQGLSGRAAVDLLRQRMLDALLAERWEEYLATHRDLQTLGVDTGLESIYYEARALAELGRILPAFQSVQTYLEVAGRSGAAYPKALDLYADLQPQYPEAKRYFDDYFVKARNTRRDFCKARIEADMPLCGCREFDDLNIAEAACAL